MLGHVDPIETLTAGNLLADRRVKSTKAIADNQRAERKSASSPGKDRK
jgi:hypothetical protein